MSSALDKFSGTCMLRLMITPAQIRAGRALVGLTQKQLADAAGLTATGLINIEKGRADPKLSTLTALKAALEKNGVIFIAANGDGPGVRLKKLEE